MGSLISAVFSALLCEMVVDDCCDGRSGCASAQPLHLCLPFPAVLLYIVCSCFGLHCMHGNFTAFWSLTALACCGIAFYF